jgi:hypothetical protein
MSKHTFDQPAFTFQLAFMSANVALIRTIFTRRNGLARWMRWRLFVRRYQFPGQPAADTVATAVPRFIAKSATSMWSLVH